MRLDLLLPLPLLLLLPPGSEGRLEPEEPILPGTFPPGFLWGVASSAYQVPQGIHSQWTAGESRHILGKFISKAGGGRLGRGREGPLQLGRVDGGRGAHGGREQRPGGRGQLPQLAGGRGPGGRPGGRHLQILHRLGQACAGGARHRQSGGGFSCLALHCCFRGCTTTGACWRSAIA
jgi:hypothetical protein